LFTSHNIELLDSGLLRDDEIWFIEKGNDGSSEYRSIAEYTGIRKETSRKKLYKAGKFGAWPIVSSYTGEYNG
jgi:AAA15 family ATPase/GTPase